jgi:predicted nucleotide-binding protein (sugar kinase/HSP70/actin superfamily)
MGMLVGMPRGMIYYKYFPFWRAFFGELGISVTTSSPTNKKLLNVGLEVAENEFCLPLKVFYGHTLSLKDEVDALFIPRLVSVEKGEYTCPKLLGLPDLIRAADDDLPEVISPTINMRLGKRKYWKTLYDLGRRFSSNPARIYSAYRKAIEADTQFHTQLRQGLTPEEAIVSSESGVRVGADVSVRPSDGPTQRSAPTCHGQLPTQHPTSDIRHPTFSIGVAGHAYNIYDSYITMDLMKRLKGFGARIITPENLPPEVIEEEAADLPKKLFWTYEKEIVGACFHWLSSQSVHGIIYVLAFACGPDSFVHTVVEHRARKEGKIPVMPIVIDEHSTEVGLVTRLEAFVDMIKRKLA